MKMAGLNHVFNVTDLANKCVTEYKGKSGLLYLKFWICLQTNSGIISVLILLNFSTAFDNWVGHSSTVDQVLSPGQKLLCLTWQLCVQVDQHDVIS